MTVVWERQVDSAGAARRWSRFGLYFGIPAAVALVVAVALGGFGAFLGVLILVGLSGLLGASWVFFLNLGHRMNPTITREGDELVWARRRVPLAQVTQWSTFMGEASMLVAGPASTPIRSSAPLGIARFRLADGTEVEFVFAHLKPIELEHLRATLTPHIGAPWHDIDRGR